MGEKTKHSLLLLLLCLSGLVHRSAAFVFWTAIVETRYVNGNNTVGKYCECGVYGRNSPLDQASGIVVLPTGDPYGCGSDSDYSRNSSYPPWIALVKRGNCTFSEKINAAKAHGAAAVVVYNMDGSGNDTTHMAHPEAEGIVAIMIGNFKGMEIVKMVNSGVDVMMIIDAGNPHGPWLDTYWLHFLSISFFIVTAASFSYFVFISASRLYNLSSLRRSQKKLKSEAKKAIARLEVRTLKRGDEETTSDSLCAVCIESYKAGDVVTVLTCDHIFHKTCIEPWLLERRTCPMCKCDILKALGVEDDDKDNISTSSPPEVTVITVAGGDALYEVPLNNPMNTDPMSPEPMDTDPERQEHRYDNRAFEGDSEATRG